MPPVNVLIKPASSACNMACTYCFYRDVACHRQEDFQGMLSLELMEKVITGAMEFAEGSCSFLFQGGEPTLAGLDIYRSFVTLVQKHAKENVAVSYAIQTNAYHLGEAWCEFFRDNKFLVGVSLDGPADLHNLNRPDQTGRNTFNDVMRSIDLLRRFSVVSGCARRLLYQCAAPGQLALDPSRRPTGVLRDDGALLDPVCG